MNNMIRSGQAWLASQMRAHVAAAATFIRGEMEIEVAATEGGAISFPYDGAADPPQGKVYFLQVEDLVDGDDAAVVPREGDELQVVEGEVTRTFELVPFGAEPPARRSGLWYVCQCLETTGGKRRRDTLADLEVPSKVDDQNEFGEVSRVNYQPLARDIYVKIEPTGGSETTVGKRLAGQQSFRVTLATADVAADVAIVPVRARIKVRSGWLDGKFLYVESATRDSASGIETTLLCKLGGLD